MNYTEVDLYQNMVDIFADLKIQSKFIATLLENGGDHEGEIEDHKKRINKDLGFLAFYIKELQLEMDIDRYFEELYRFYHDLSIFPST